MPHHPSTLCSSKRATGATGLGTQVLAFEASPLPAKPPETLAQILQRPGWLRLPLLFLRGIPRGSGDELIYLVHHADGEGAVVEIEDRATPEVAPNDWTLLSADVLRVLAPGCSRTTPEVNWWRTCRTAAWSGKLKGRRQLVPSNRGRAVTWQAAIVTASKRAHCRPF